MIAKNFDSLRVLHGAFSSNKQARSRITKTASNFFVEKMCRAMFKKSQQFNLSNCKGVFGG